MKKLFTLRSLSSLAVLLIAVSALISGIKVSVHDVQDAAFFPLAAFAVTLSYALGFSTWPARRAWIVILMTGFYIALSQSAQLLAPTATMLLAIPQFELGLLRWLLSGEAVDVSVFQVQFAKIMSSAGAFAGHAFSLEVQDPAVREFLWDMPLLLLATWSGWGTGRRNQILLALAPSLGLHAFLLNYTGEDTGSLQVAVFALVLLIGINQKWTSATERTVNSEKAVKETYSVILLLSIGLAILAGLTPSIAIQSVAQKLTKEDEIAKTIGLEREIVQAYPVSGLPRQHLIGLGPGLSQTLVFTVRTGELPATENAISNEAAPRHYWRWLTYDIYNGQGWSTSPVETNSYEAGEVLLTSSNRGRQVIHQQVEKAIAGDNRLYWTGSLASVSQPFSASWRTTPETSPEADMLGAVTEQQSYQADSVFPIVSEAELRASSQEYPDEIRTRYMSLPDSVPPRVRELALNLTLNAADPYDKAKVIETYLRQFPYTLNIPPPPPDVDIADYFLFDLRTGYCDYYATSMIVMARAVGLPARLVVGYANGIYDPQTAQYVIHEAEAHSWVEVYFTGVGWIEFEPTAGQLPIDLPKELPQEEIAIPEPEPKPVAYAKGGFYPHANLLPRVFGTASSILFFSSLWFLRTQGLLRNHKTIGSIYSYLFYHGKKIYRDAPTHESPSIFSKNLRARLASGDTALVPAPQEIKLLTDLYIREAYSAHAVTREEHALAIRVWRRLFWRLLYARAIRL